ncbi:basic blue protein [Quercus suber]|uniref:Basic blue protein n=1 Tax=Quercus suber TaxID=58331 RepID=A0AAW0LJC8_QUESU
MAPQGRGNAIVVSVLLLLGMLLHCENIWAATYTVGDDNSWDFDIDTWPDGKTFRAGDVLMFNYGPREDDVNSLNQQGYMHGI